MYRVRFGGCCRVAVWNSREGCSKFRRRRSMGSYLFLVMSIIERVKRLRPLVAIPGLVIS